VDEPLAAASLAVRSPSASCQRRAATSPGGNQPPGTCLLSVSHALEALLRPTPAGLVSCRSRPWGCRPSGSISVCRAGHPSREPLALLRFTARPDRSLQPPEARHNWKRASIPKAFAERRSVRPAPLQGFDPCSRPHPSSGCLSSTPDRDPRGLYPPWGLLPLHRRPSSGPILSWAWPAGRELDRWLPCRVLPVERSAGLSRVCHPLRGSVTSSPLLGRSLLLDPCSSSVVRSGVATFPSFLEERAPRVRKPVGAACR